MPPQIYRHLRPSLFSSSKKWIGVRLSSTATKHHEPLRVLFCGADAFSIYSLRALHKLQQANPEKIASIDVVCRPDKRVGRGLKKIQEVPIKPIATSLSLPLHQIDTFTSWTPPTPSPPNLIITVSFGLLVPSRILSSATYGGLNIHPSLLPDLRGPAPLQHALLTRRSHTGVSLQTMHPTKFDHGLVLAQTAHPGLPIPETATPQSLLETLGPVGAELLVRGIEENLFLPPFPSANATQPAPATATSKAHAHAPKITPSDRQISWPTWSSSEILLRDRVLGRLWDSSLWSRAGLDRGGNDRGGKRDPGDKQQQKPLRVTFTGPWRVTSGVDGVEISPGTPYLATKVATGAEEVRFATCDGKAVVPSGMTVEGGKKDQGLGGLVERIKEMEE